jgi:hypothetical protein
VGALDHGESYREYLKGALDRDDINWELKSSIKRMLELHDHWYDTADAYAKEIKKLMDERHQLTIAFDCEAGKNVKLQEENERLHRQMHSSQPYYYDEWKRMEARIEEALKEAEWATHTVSEGQEHMIINAMVKTLRGKK